MITVDYLQAQIATFEQDLAGADAATALRIDGALALARHLLSDLESGEEDVPVALTPTPTEGSNLA